MAGAFPESTLNTAFPHFPAPVSLLFFRMNKTQRILFFCIGLVVGLIALKHILADRAAKKEAADLRDSQRNIPGMLREYALNGAPIYGEGVLESKTGPGADGFAQTRRVLTGGRTRYDPEGRPLPEEFMAITEYYAGSGPLTDKTPVSKYDFIYADRVSVKLREAADSAKVFAAVKSLGAHLHPVPGAPLVVMVRHTKPGLDFVPAVLAALKSEPGVVSAEPVRLDWVKEAKR